MIKTCKECDDVKKISDFYFSKNASDKLSSVCKSCKKQAAKAYYTANKDRVRKKIKAWKAGNLEKIKEYNKKYREKRKSK